MKPLYYILLLSFVLIACKKDRNKPSASNDCKNACYILTGAVIDTPRQIKLSNVKLNLYSRNLGYTFYNPEQLVTSTTTDDSGNYRFSVSSGSIDLSYKYYYIKVIKDDYFIEGSTEGSLYLDDLSTNMIDKPFAWNIKMYRPAILNVKIETTKQLNGLYFGYTCNFGRIAMGKTIRDEDVGKLFAYKTAGGLKTYIRWNFDKKQYTDSVIIAAGQSATYVIKL